MTTPSGTPSGQNRSNTQIPVTTEIRAHHSGVMRCVPLARREMMSRCVPQASARRDCAPRPSFFRYCCSGVMSGAYGIDVELSTLFC